MRKGLIKISKKCRAAKKEMQGYAWDEKAQEDKPLKINDHAMDAMRYFVQTKHLVSFRSDSKPIWLY
jgi:phage terminase large subunit